jgi:hypothetical protein
MHMRNVEFKDHVMFSFNLSEHDFTRLLDEFLGHFSSTLEAFVCQRHTELRREGKKNPEIYRLIVGEVSERRFSTETLTERQVRRIVYG